MDMTIAAMRQTKDIGTHVALVCIYLLNIALQHSQGGHPPGQAERGREFENAMVWESRKTRGNVVVVTVMNRK